MKKNLIAFCFLTAFLVFSDPLTGADLNVYAQTTQIAPLPDQVQQQVDVQADIGQLPVESPSALPAELSGSDQNLLAAGPGEKVIPTIEERGLIKALSDAERQALSAPYIRPDIRSLMFTTEQYNLLRNAQRGFNVNAKAFGIEEDAKPSYPGETEQAALGEQPKVKVAAIRELFLGGILYTDDKNWTIYLNGQRVTLANLPKDVLDIKVSKEFIDLLWFDPQLNKAFPIRLRANQRFNLDSKIFLPGRAG